MLISGSIPEPDTTPLSRRLRELRQNLQRNADPNNAYLYTLRRFSHHLGVSPGTLSAWESGRRTPTDTHLHQLSIAFNIDETELRDLRASVREKE